MKRCVLLGVVFLALAGPAARAITPETMEHIRDICAKTQLSHPSIEDEKQIAYCRGYIKAKADDDPKEYACVPVEKITVDQMIEAFLRVTDDPKKYGYDRPGSDLLLQKSAEHMVGDTILESVCREETIPKPSGWPPPPPAGPPPNR